jgi:very-short-patch-repair endonuclease
MVLDAASPSSLSRLRERAGVRAVDRARTLRKTATTAEQSLWHHLRNRQLSGHKFRRQVPIGAFVADFACVEAKLVLEVDGGQHYQVAGLASDAARTRWLSERGWTVLRFGNHEVWNEMDGVLRVVLTWLEEHPPSPQPSPAGGRGSEDITAKEMT